MRFSRYLLLLALLFSIVSCEVKIPENIIAPEKMEAFLYDYHLVQSMSGEYVANDYKEKLFYSHIFQKHGITSELFDSSLLWYNRYPKHLRKIYTNLETRLEKEVEMLDGAKGSVDTGVTLEMAYLATDTAELWTASKLKMLSATPLSSKIAFSFDIPDDTTFMAGDSLSLSFGAHFVSGGVAGVEQRAYASVLLEYDDETRDHKGLLVETSGKCVLALPRNFNSRPKHFSGFVYYSDNDSTAQAKLLLDEISLKRVHPVLAGEGEGEK